MSEPVVSRRLSRVELAAAFGVHPATVVTWDESGMPCAVRGSRGRASLYALPEVVQWYMARELAARGVANGKLDPLLERAKLDRARREAVEHALAIKRGEYVPLDAMVNAFSARVVVARDAFRGLPSWGRTALGLTAEAARMMAEKIDTILNDLADAQPSHEAREEKGADATPNGHHPVHRHGTPDPDPLAAALP